MEQDARKFKDLYHPASTRGLEKSRNEAIRDQEDKPEAPL